jgi:hypothetical protein
VGTIIEADDLPEEAKAGPGAVGAASGRPAGGRRR